MLISFPKYMVLKLCTEWLQLDEVCLVDTALCSKNCRLPFLRSLQNSLFVFASCKRRPSLCWCMHRRILSSTLDMDLSAPCEEQVAPGELVLPIYFQLQDLLMRNGDWSSWKMIPRLLDAVNRSLLVLRLCNCVDVPHEDLSKLLRSCQITLLELTIINCDLNQESLYLFLSCDRLTSLTLANIALSEEGWLFFSAPKSLQKLYLIEVNILCVAFECAMRTFRDGTLTHLSIIRCDHICLDDAWKSVAYLQLQSLHFAESATADRDRPDDQFAFMYRNRAIPSMVEFRCDDCSFCLLHSFVGAMVNLTKLTLKSIKLKRRILLDVVISAKSLKELHVLDMDEPFSHELLTLGSCCPGVQVVELQHCTATAPTIRDFVAQCRELKTLSLGGVLYPTTTTVAAMDILCRLVRLRR